MKFVGGYRDVKANANIDLDGSPFNGVRTLGAQDLKQWSGGLQITGKALDDRIDFASGAFVFSESGFDSSTSIALPALSGAALAQQIFYAEVENRSMGIYGQATVSLTDQFSVVGGLPYSVEDKNIVSFNRQISPSTGALIACSITGSDPTTCRIARKNDFDGVSYTAGVNYQLTPDILLYAKMSQGFRSGGQNLRASVASGTAFVAFKPEVAREQEVGIKSELFDRRVRFNLAAFYNEVSDIQRSTLVIGAGGATSTIIGNAGKARLRTH